jgi:hypothetical protein
LKNSASKFILIISIIAITIAGCNKDTNRYAKNTYGFQPPIDKLYWGMSLEEIEDTLSILDGVDNVVYNYDKPITTIILPEKINKFGYKAKVYLQICDAPDDDGLPYKSSYLIDIKLIYTDIDVQKLKENMIEDFNDFGEDKVSIIYKKCTTWQSKDKIGDLETEIFNKLQNYWKLVDKHHKDLSQFSVAKSEKKSINTVLLTYGKKDSAMIIYEGDTAIPINKICINHSN